MAQTRKSARIKLVLKAAQLFAFGIDPTTFELIAGAQQTHTFEPANDGLPEVTAAQKGAVVVTFYSAAIGGTVIGGSTTILGKARSSIVSVTYDEANDEFTIEMDATGLTYPDGKDQDEVFFELSVIQNEAGD